MTEKTHLVKLVITILEETKTKLEAINTSKIDWSIEGFIEDLSDSIFELNTEIEDEDEDDPVENWFPVNQLANFRLYKTITSKESISECYKLNEDKEQLVNLNKCASWLKKD